jgi:hypothetical protein
LLVFRACLLFFGFGDGIGNSELYP